MKVILPTNTTHNIVLEPRYYPSGAVSLEVINESTKDVTYPVITYVVLNGVMTATFDLTVLESDRYSIKIKDGLGVVYRGNLFSTSQTTQDYKLTKNKYIYV